MNVTGTSNSLFKRPAWIKQRAERVLVLVLFCFFASNRKGHQLPAKSPENSMRIFDTFLNSKEICIALPGMVCENDLGRQEEEPRIGQLSCKRCPTEF